MILIKLLSVQVLDHVSPLSCRFLFRFVCSLIPLNYVFHQTACFPRPVFIRLTSFAGETGGPRIWHHHSKLSSASCGVVFCAGYTLRSFVFITSFTVDRGRPHIVLLCLQLLVTWRRWSYGRRRQWLIFIDKTNHPHRSPATAVNIGVSVETLWNPRFR